MGAKPAETVVNSDDYCRELEAYLCRKNDGHLIRIVGPSFERVCGWAAQGIPFKIACQGIDRYFDRHYAKGARRRPVQIDFCEADILDAFDAWRRAVGVRLPGADAIEHEKAKRQRQSLPEHLKRALERVTMRLASGRPMSLDMKMALEHVADEVASLSEMTGAFRGEARVRAIERLVDLDRTMLDAARAHTDTATLDLLRRDALEQLGSFRERMSGEAFERAVAAAIDRLLRDREQLPVVAFE